MFEKNEFYTLELSSICETFNSGSNSLSTLFKELSKAASFPLSSCGISDRFSLSLALILPQNLRENIQE